MTTEMKKSLYDAIYIISRVINNTVPERKRISEMDMDRLFSACKFHNLTSIVCMAIESSGVEVSKKWQEEKLKAIRKNLMLDAERKKLFEYCENKKIWYMPLKGVILKEFYPQIGMRQMSDNDILFDEKYREEIHDYFVGNGFKSVNYGKGHHDEYVKEPLYNYEMHTALFDVADNKRLNKRWIDYYKNIKDRLIKDENNSYGYHFSDEDFYIYFVVHGYKHYEGGGTGIKTLLDCYIYNREKKLNREYINNELSKLELCEFEARIRNLSKKIFNKAAVQLTENDVQELEYIMSSGTYGTVSNRVENRFRSIESKTGKRSKWRYFCSRLFPDMESVKAYDPFFYRHKWLMPVFVPYRLIRGVVARRKKVSSELNAFAKRKKDRDK